MQELGHSRSCSLASFQRADIFIEACTQTCICSHSRKIAYQIKSFDTTTQFVQLYTGIMKLCIFPTDALVFIFPTVCVTKVLGQWTVHGWH